MFKPAKEDEGGANILLADPELEGLSPALAANNMQMMLESNNGPFMPAKPATEDHLKYIPVEINGRETRGIHNVLAARVFEEEGCDCGATKEDDGDANHCNERNGGNADVMFFYLICGFQQTYHQ